MYRRACSASIAGLVIQRALVFATGAAALWSDSQAIYSATWHMLGGLPIWVILVILYQQHESERVQRLAAEKLAASEHSTAAIFGDVGDDLDAADNHEEVDEEVLHKVVDHYLVDKVVVAVVEEAIVDCID